MERWLAQRVRLHRFRKSIVKQNKTYDYFYLMLISQKTAVFINQ